MCGIFACFYSEKSNSIQLQIDANKISYRGPDCTITENIPNAFLCFHRLAIIDTTENSNKIISRNGVYVLCNGEIYNYKHLNEKYQFKPETGSDCEVILDLFLIKGNTFANELDGDFAYVIWDSREETLRVSSGRETPARVAQQPSNLAKPNSGKYHAGRDRVGVRPLFYSISEKGVAFASEGKSLITFPNVIPFPPSHTINGDSECSSLTKWWVPPPQNRFSYESSKVILRELLVSAVKKRMMSDRPVGFLVSGGLDSSLIASIASRLLDTPITTFSIGFQGSPDLIAAKKVANFLGSNHHEVIITQKDVIEALPQVIYATETYDITTIRASIPMWLLGRYIRQNTDIKVIFSGEGADELFGGYLYFHYAPNYQEFQKESVRLIDDLYLYDVLRGDRSTANHGLEIRVPFLDADVLNFAISTDPMFKFTKPEKKLIREAFCTKGETLNEFLPSEILNRQKEAFSDGVGSASVLALKMFSESSVLEKIPPKKGAIPYTSESWLYYSYFNGFFGDSLTTKYYWMPKWTDAKDPSATVLGVHSGG